MKTNRPVWLTALLVFVAAISLAAQIPPPSSGISAAKEEPITLSPFEVSTTQDTGYAGQDTLSGSRLRTNLRDVAAAISPMTAEFLRDIAATNIADAIEYGVNVRMDTDDARAAGPVGDVFNDTTRSFRVRGLPGGSRSVNFFSALGEIDVYMIDRLELSRGPNSILYGFGSPSGKINVGTKQAMTNKNAYSITNRTDSWGGQRSSADANFVLLKKKVALRLDVLRGQESSWRSYGYNDQDRIFLSGKWQVDRQTSVKAEYEFGRQKRYVPRPFFGVDLKSMWQAAGGPLFNNFSASYVPGQPFTPGAAGTPGTAIRDTGSASVAGTQERSSADYVVVSDRFPYAQNFKNFTTSAFPTAALISTDFDLGRSNPKSAMEANWVNGKFNNDTVSVFFQRELLRNLNLELAVNRQRYTADTRNISSWYTYGVAVDSNRYRPNGTLKPADELYYFEISPNHFVTRTMNKTHRITLSYEQSIRDDLATLRVAGLGEVMTTDNRFRAYVPTWMKGPAITSGGAFNPSPENGANTVYYRYYIKDLSVLNDPNYLIPGRMDLSGATKYQDPKTGAVSNIYMQDINRAQGYVVDYDREASSYMGVSQLFLFKGRAAITAGYRNDRLKNWQAPSVRDPAAETIAPNSGAWLPVAPRSTVPNVFSGQTKTLGGVVNLTSWLSGFYNTSSSISTPGSQWITPKDPTNLVRADIAPSPSGITDDYGIKLSLIKNRLFVTATKFHTISKNEFSGSGFNKNNPVFIWTALANSSSLSASERNAALQQTLVMGQVQGYTQDSESRGYEFEVVGQIIPSWSVSANFARTKSSRSNIAREYRAYLDYWKPYWKKYKDFALTQNPNAAVQLAPSSTDWNTPAVIAATGDFTANTDSINEAIADGESVFFDNPHVFEGRPFIGDNKYNLNFRTRYDFSTEKLKGLTIGAGMRMRRGRVAGAKTEYEFLSGTDYTDTWNGRQINKVSLVEAVDQNLYDFQLGYNFPVFRRKFRWSIQLNVNNVTNERALIVNNTNPTTLAPMTYRYQDPREFILTNTISF